MDRVPAIGQFPGAEYGGQRAVENERMARGDLFKVGLLVEDLEAAMRDVGRWLGVTWTPVQESPLVLQVGLRREAVELRYVYSTSGPVFLELLQSRPDGYYAAPQGSHLHHVGRWVDDLAKASAELTAADFPMEAAGIDGEGNWPAMFAFHRGRHGLRVELVDRAMQPSFEGWLSGGTLDLG